MPCNCRPEECRCPARCEAFEGCDPPVKVVRIDPPQQQQQQQNQGDSQLVQQQQQQKAVISGGNSDDEFGNLDFDC